MLITLVLIMNRIINQHEPDHYLCYCNTTKHNSLL